MAGARRGSRVEGNAQHLRGLRCQHRWSIADCSYAIELHVAQCVQGFGRPVELHGHGAIAPGIVHHVAAIGRQREVDAQTPRRVREDANLISGGRREEQ